MRGCGSDEVVTYPQASWGTGWAWSSTGSAASLVQRGVDALALHGRLVASAGKSNSWIAVDVQR